MHYSSSTMKRTPPSGARVEGRRGVHRAQRVQRALTKQGNGTRAAARGYRTRRKHVLFLLLGRGERLGQGRGRGPTGENHLWRERSAVSCGSGVGPRPHTAWQIGGLVTSVETAATIVLRRSLQNNGGPKH